MAKTGNQANRKKVMVAFDEDLAAWVSFAGSLYEGGMTQYVNEAVRRDMAAMIAADDELQATFEAHRRITERLRK